jgi:hypothetical protein
MGDDHLVLDVRPSPTDHVDRLEEAMSDKKRNDSMPSMRTPGRRWNPRTVGLIGIACFVASCSVGSCSPGALTVTGKDSADPTWKGLQSETVATSARSGDHETLVVTYNDDTDDGKVTYTTDDRVVYPGASLLGWSYSLDHGKTWTYGGKVKPPSGIAALWGDPAIVTSNTSYSTVYISSLAIGANKIPASGHHGWLSDGSITGACVARSDDGGVHFKIHSCFSANNDFYDGASMAAGAGGDKRIFAAYVDVPASRIDVWASPDGVAPFAQLGNPFPGMQMFSHPRLAYDRANGALLVAAIANNSHIYFNRLLGTAWQQPVLGSQVTSGISITVNGENIRWAYGFSFDVGAPSQSGEEGRVIGDDAVRLLYTTRDAETKRLYIRGSRCRADLTVCLDAPEWGTTPGNLHTPGEQWNPTVKAWSGFIGLPPEWKAVYQSTDDSPNGISVKQGNLAVLPNGTRVFVPFDLVAARPACPDYRDGSPGHAVGGYWGDYDEMAMIGFKGSSPEFLFPFADSSKGCVQQWKFFSSHVHVGAVVFQ